MTNNLYDVCLIICFYNGEREYLQEEYYKEYIKLQKKNINRLKHNLKRIVFVISEDKLEKECISENDGITYYYRNNKNLSFGGWIDAMFKFNHDYYIFGEDDYLFTKNNFDKILVDAYNENKTEYLVNWRQFKNSTKSFIGRELISTIGIISSNYKYKFKDYNKLIYNKNRAMGNFIKTFTTISSLNRNFDNFIYWNGKKEILYSNGVKGYIGIDISKDQIDMKKLFVCCYQYYVKLTYEELKNINN